MTVLLQKMVGTGSDEIGNAESAETETESGHSQDPASLSFVVTSFILVFMLRAQFNSYTIFLPKNLPVGINQSINPGKRCGVYSISSAKFTSKL